MYEMDNEQWVSWKKKRRNTLICYLILMFFAGVDYSMVLATLYLYLEDVVKTNYPNFYYGFAIALFCFTSIVFGIIAARCLDKSRNIKEYTYVVISLEIVGNILYALPFSVAYPLLGRFLTGFGDTLQSVYSGEIVRLYEIEESERALWWVESVYTIGIILGPAFSIVFKNVQFSIGHLEINYLNIIGIIMAGVLVLLYIATYLLMHDCSKEFDLKEHLHKKEMAKKNVNCYENQNYQGDLNMQESEIVRTCTEKASLINDVTTIDTLPTTVRAVLNVLWTNYDLKLMFISTLMYSYMVFGEDLLLPLISYEIMHWDLTAVTVIFVIAGIFYVLTQIGLSNVCTTDEASYKMCIICSLFQLVCLCILIAMKELNRNFTRDVILMISFLFTFTFSLCMQAVLFKCIVAKMVPSNIQGFVESLRFAVSKIGTLVTSLTTVLSLTYLQWWSAILIVIVVILLLCLLSRKETLCNIEVIPFSDLEDKNETVVKVTYGSNTYHTNNV